MALADTIAPITGIEDPAQARVVLYQAGRPVHAPLDSVGLATDTEMASAIDAAIDGLATAEVRSRLVNGAMQIGQENGTASVGNGFYPADQWLLGASSSSTIGAQRGIAGTSNPIAYYISVGASPAETSATGTEYVVFQQLIEGIRVNDFGWGDAATAKQVVLAFDVNLPVAGTYWVSIPNTPSTHTFLGSYTISAGEVATWVRKSITVPAGAINAGTWAVGNAASIILNFAFHCGPTYTGVAGFQTGLFLAGPGQALGLSTASRCWLTNVGLYLDPQATGLPPAWVMPDEAEELRACQRYWRQIKMRSMQYVSTYIGLSLPLSPEMRTIPSVSHTDNAGTASRFTTASSGDGVTIGAGGVNAGPAQVQVDVIHLGAATTGWWLTFVTLNARM